MPSSEQPSTPTLKPLSMRSNFAWTFAGNAFAAASQWLILALLTKTTGDEITGQFVLALAICTPLFMFAGLDLRVLQATDGKNEFSFAEYKRLRWMTASVALVLVPIICVIWGHGGATGWVICGVAIGKLAESVSDIHYGLLQKSERMDRVSRSLVAHGFLSSLGLIAGLTLTGQLAVGVWVAALARFGVLFCYDIPLARNIEQGQRGAAPSPSHEWKSENSSLGSGRLAQLARVGFPLACKVLLIALVANVTRYFIYGWGGLVALGIFGPIVMLMTAGTTVARALNQSVASKLGRLFQAGNMNSFKSLVRRLQALYLGLGLAGMLVAWLAGPMLLSLLFRDDFVEHHGLFVLVMIAAAIQYQGGALDMAMVAQRRVHILAPLSAVTLGVLSAMCAWLIPTHGLEGAGYAMLVSRVPRVTALVWLVHFATQESPAENQTSAYKKRAA